MIVLTGGAGFIGSCFLAKLNAEGISDVVVVDELGSGEKWKNLLGKNYEDVVHKDEFIDLINQDRLPWPVSAVVHLGACSSTTEKDADYLLYNNYHYTLDLAKWAIEQDVRFIYASSGATYGDGSLGFSDSLDLLPQLRPLNMYGMSKHMFDQWVLKHELENRLCGLKFFNVFGPNEYHKGDMSSVVFKSYQHILDSGTIELFRSYRPDYKDGEQKRDFVYVKDCNEVLWWLLNEEKINGIFNIGSGEARTWNDLAKSVFTALGRVPHITYIDMPENLQGYYQYFTQASVTTLKEAGCPVEFTRLEEAVADYVQTYLTKPNRYL